MNQERFFKLGFALSLAIFVYAYVDVLQPDARWTSITEPQLAEARPAQGRGEGGKKEPTYDLQAMNTLNRAVLHVEDSYVDPKRVNHRKMIGAALKEIQRVVPEVMVHVTTSKGPSSAQKSPAGEGEAQGEAQGEAKTEGEPISVDVQVNEHRKRFSLEKISSHYHLIFLFKDVFRFIEGNLKHFDDLREIEYAAINGMLSTLDPHSVLLPPEAYTEMKMSTQGHFGGLGIVIGVRENQLTIINPIEDTPASRAGLQANDRIVQIMLDSTVNMSLSDAVDLMRGEPGTQIDIHVTREGWTAPKKFTLTRAEIKVKSVKHLALDHGVGVVRVRNFQSTTVQELKDALEAMGGAGKKGKLKGLILDLRGNPGGLLDQAAKMADLFISEGTLVKTVGFGDKVREPKMASERGTLSDLPIAVLVNESSASASEIVAGALKNHERAVIIGQRTFGKGSVQLLFDNPDESALKLTIAQYLTPGDISIQSVGVTPSIELSPILISEEDTYMYGVPDREHGEATLSEHLTNDKSEAAKLQKPLMSMRYLQDPELLKKMRDEPNKIFVDFEIEFARDLLKASASPRLKRLVQRAEKLISQQQRLQERALDERLKERGVRWSSEGEVSAKGAKGEASVSLTPGGVVTAGQDLTVTLTVRNTSTQPLHKLRAITSSESNLLKGHEFLFGYVPPGEERSWTQKIKVDPSSKRRRDEVTVTFTAEGEGEVAPLSFPVEVKALPHPLFALRYELSDREGGDGDGLLEPGEEVSVTLSFENKGEGESVELVGQLSNEGNGVAPGLFIKQGRVQPEKQQLKAGERGELTFVFKVKEGWREPLTKAYLMLIDPKLRESSSELLSIAIHPQGSDVTPRSATVKGREGALKLYPQPHSESFAVSQSDAPLKVDGCLEAKAEGCAWYRLKGASGWLWARGDEVSEVKAEAGSPAPYFSVAPPSITLSQLPHHTTDERVKLSGVARCDEGLEDVMIYVNNRKVFFLAKTEMKRRDEAPFEAELPLEEGVNYITIYARHSEHRVGQEVVVISRPKPEKKD